MFSLPQQQLLASISWVGAIHSGLGSRSTPSPDWEETGGRRANRALGAASRPMLILSGPQGKQREEESKPILSEPHLGCLLSSQPHWALRCVSHFQRRTLSLGEVLADLPKISQLPSIRAEIQTRPGDC